MLVSKQTIDALNWQIRSQVAHCYRVAIDAEGEQLKVVTWLKWPEFTDLFRIVYCLDGLLTDDHYLLAQIANVIKAEAEAERKRQTAA